MSLTPLPELDIYDEFDLITVEDIADAEVNLEQEKSNLRIAAILLGGLWLLDQLRGSWHIGNRLLGNEQELAILDQLTQQQAVTYQQLYGGYISGGLDLTTWQVATVVELVRSHVVSSAFGVGGFEAMTPQTLEQLSAFIQAELEFFAGLVDRVLGGQSIALTNAHLQMYANHVQASFWEGRREVLTSSGRTQEARFLGMTEHCGDCLGYAGQGWVPIGTLPVPGMGSICLSNCGCTMAFR